MEPPSAGPGHLCPQFRPLPLYPRPMPIDFTPTPSGGLSPTWSPDADGKFRWTTFMGGRRQGHSEAVRMAIVTEAASPEDAAAALADLDRCGMATMAEGRHVPAPYRRPPVVFFDEGPR